MTLCDWIRQQLAFLHAARAAASTVPSPVTGGLLDALTSGVGTPLSVRLDVLRSVLQDIPLGGLLRCDEQFY